MKSLDLNKTLYELTESYPELIDILSELGFELVKKPIARKTLGKIITIPAGCRKKGINLDNVIKILRKKGFNIVE